MTRGSYSELSLSREGMLAVRWAEYWPVYDREISCVIVSGRPVRLLEIGVVRGCSLAIWEALLPLGSGILGIGIDPACAPLPSGSSVQVMILDVTKRATHDAALGDTVFDIITGDGPHRFPDIVVVFGPCFDRIAPGGLRIVEDLHAAYWPSFSGRQGERGFAIKFLKPLVEAMHADPFVWDTAIPDAQRSALVARCAEIVRVAFHGPIAVIERAAITKDRPHPRVCALPTVANMFRASQATMRPIMSMQAAQ